MSVTELCFNALSGYIIISTGIKYDENDENNKFQCPIGLHHHFYIWGMLLLALEQLVSMPYRATSSFLRSSTEVRTSADRCFNALSGYIIISTYEKLTETKKS